MLLMNRRLPALPVRRLAARGFSLIEVLVSMFIVSLGILALAGLLQSASRYGKMSELRATATLLANDIADHIRANPGGATLNAYNVTSAFPATAARDNRTTPNDKCDTVAVCPVQEIAYVDLYLWSQRLFATLPQGTPYIKYNAPTAGGTQSGTVDVWVAWMDPNTSSGSSTERPDAECPAGLNVSTSKSVRCIYLQVGL
jgi:type IV pilus assembly protein PilV